MGLGNAGGGNQALFGSSGGQDIFQKATWVFCALLLGGSLVLSIVKGKNSLSGNRFNTSSRSQQSMPVDDYPMSDEI